MWVSTFSAIQNGGKLDQLYLLPEAKNIDFRAREVGLLASEEEVAHHNVILNGLHDIRHNLLCLVDGELLVVEAKEVVLVAGPDHEQRRVPGGQQGKALDETSCRKHSMRLGFLVLTDDQDNF